MDIKLIGKTTSGKYKVKVGDKTITTYDDVLIKNGLLYKKKIDDEKVKEIESDHLYYDAYNKTISYIMKHQRCTKEIKKYLEKFDLSENDKSKIINQLKNIGILNDKVFVKSYIADSISLSKDGPKKIREYLVNMDIDENIIDEELSNIDEDIIIDKALKMISKKFKLNHKYSNYQLKQKISMEMVNLGYYKDLIDSLIDNFEVEDDSLLEKEYDKLYNKLSKKYEGYDLQNKIKQKLYAKGFDINMINNLVLKKGE